MTTQTGSEVQDNTAAILALIGDGEDPQAEPAGTAGAAETRTNTATAGADEGDGSHEGSTEAAGDGTEGDAAPPETEASGDEKGDEPATKPPAIEPPASWKAELRERWNAIPVDLQRELAQQEQDRTAGVNAKLNEAAEARKAAEAVTAAVTQERQQLADQLKPAIERLANAFMEEFADIKTPADVERMAREDPGRKVVFDTKVAQIHQANATQQGLIEANRRDAEKRGQEQLAEQRKQLVEKWPDMANTETAKKHGDRILDYLRAQGFKDEEMGRLAADHRLMLILRDVLTGIDLKKANADAAAKVDAARKSLETKKVPDKPTKTVRPGSATTVEMSADKRAAALRKQALRSGRDQDKVDAILAAIGD